MPSPIASEVESIAENLRTTLDAMKAGATYNYTPARPTVRESVDYSSLESFPAYEVMVGPESFEYFGKRVVNYQIYFIRCYHNGEKGMGTAARKQTNMVHDVKTAITQDVTRGGYATNTELAGVENDEGMVAPYIVSQISCKVQYLTLDQNR